MSCVAVTQPVQRCSDLIIIIIIIIIAWRAIILKPVKFLLGKAK
jgi:hypothetical protein